MPLTLAATIFVSKLFLILLDAKQSTVPFPLLSMFVDFPLQRQIKRNSMAIEFAGDLYTSAQNLHQDFTSESVSQRRAASQVARTLSFGLQKPFSKAHVHISSQCRGPHCRFDHMPGSFCFSAAGMSGQITLPCSGKPCQRLLSLATISI